MIDLVYRRIRKHAKNKIAFRWGASRNTRIKAYQKFLKLENKMLRSYYFKGESGRKCVHMRTITIDILLEYLFLYAIEGIKNNQHRSMCPLALVATGGYGRRELSPHSDLDFMVLFPNRISVSTIKNMEEMIVQEVLYVLWDLKLKIGERCFRTLNQTISESKEDVRAKNSLLEARFIAGQGKLFSQWEQQFIRYYRKDKVIDYIEDQIQSSENRHAKMGNTVYLQAPDIKEGVGGLRDYHHTRWMLRKAYGRETKIKSISQLGLLKLSSQRSLRNSYSFLLQVRNALHFYNHKPSDIVELEQQPEIAKDLGYTEEDIFLRVEQFMQDYYHHARNIYFLTQRVQKRLLSRLKEKKGSISLKNTLSAYRKSKVKTFDGFTISQGLLHPTQGNIFKKDPDRLIRVFRYRQLNSVRFDFSLTSLIYDSLDLLNKDILFGKSTQRTLRSLLSETGNVYDPLAKMNDQEILGRVMPEFGNLRGLVQHEYYHRYTADLHTLRTIQHLDQLVANPIPVEQKYCEVVEKLPHLEDLYWMLLLHDLGKSGGIKDHASRSVHLARNVLLRLEYPSDRLERILYIIKNHGNMARFSQKYDVEDPESYGTFADMVGSRENLMYLYVLTYCDAMGTAKDLWNDFKDTLHTLLYINALTVLGKPKNTLNLLRKDKNKKEKAVREKLSTIEKDEIEGHFKFMPDRYFNQYNSDEIGLHLELIHKLLLQIINSDDKSVLFPIIHWREDWDKGFSIVTVVSWDRIGLFSKIAGSFNLSGLKVLGANAITRKDHISLDTFTVMKHRGGVVDDPKCKEHFASILQDSLSNDRDLTPEIETKDNKKRERILYDFSNKKIGTRKPKVMLESDQRLKRIIVQVESKDETGLLYKISRSISNHGFDINFARITTEHQLAIDTFHISPINHTDYSLEKQINHLSASLHKIIHAEIIPI